MEILTIMMVEDIEETTMDMVEMEDVTKDITGMTETIEMIDTKTQWSSNFSIGE